MREVPGSISGAAPIVCFVLGCFVFYVSCFVFVLVFVVFVFVFVVCRHCPARLHTHFKPACLPAVVLAAYSLLRVAGCVLLVAGCLLLGCLLQYDHLTAPADAR